MDKCLISYANIVDIKLINGNFDMLMNGISVTHFRHIPSEFKHN